MAELTKDERDLLWYTANRSDLTDDSRRTNLESVVEHMLSSRLRHEPKSTARPPHPNTMAGKR